jgi:hypothetical protein
MPEGIALGLYLAQDFGILSPPKMSEDRMRVDTCCVGEHVVDLKEPKRDWTERARFAREAIPKPMFVPFEVLQSAAYDEEFLDEYLEEGTRHDFWVLLHPSIVPEARIHLSCRS